MSGPLASHESERAVLAAYLLEGTRERAPVPHEDFDSSRHRAIAESMEALEEKGVELDIRTVQGELEDRGVLERVGGVASLATLDADLPDLGRVPTYAKRIRELAHRRRLVEALNAAVNASDQGQDSFREAMERVRKIDGAGAVAAGDRPRAVGVHDLLATEFEPRRWILEGLIQERDLAMAHAFRGVGKSRFAQGLGIAVASGSRFLRYEAPSPRGVLLVDGELPREEIQAMLAAQIAGSSADLAAPFKILSADLSNAHLPSLVTPEGQRIVEAELEDVELLIIDNLSTLCSGAGPENDAESWDAMQEWLLDLRRRGVAGLLVHHDNRTGGQRGTSKREDVLSTVVQLRRPEDYSPSQGAVFEVHVMKGRGLVGKQAEPFEAALSTDERGRAAWTWRPLASARDQKLWNLYQRDYTQREMAEELGIGLATVNRHLKRIKREKRNE